jgi:hypothetical protein
VAGTDISFVDLCAEKLAQRVARDSVMLEEQIVSGITSEIPELAGSGVRIRELLSRLAADNVANVLAAIRCHAPIQNPFIPLVNLEYARFLAQRRISADKALRGYQILGRVLVCAFIDNTGLLTTAPGDASAAVQTALAYVFAYVDAAGQEALRTHVGAQRAWTRRESTLLMGRIDSVLDGTVTDTGTAERMLGYPVSGRHVALVNWGEPFSVDRLDVAEVKRRLRVFRGVQDVLVAIGDDLTLLCWLHVPEEAPIDEWISLVKANGHATRTAFGEPARGMEGFRLSYRQAQAAGTVLAASWNGVRVTRYRDVAALSFVLGRAVECRAWLEAVLGDLAADGEETQELRNTFHVFLEEGESTAAASRKLFVHRNTVRYRVERAAAMLPRPLREQRLEVALALRCCLWVQPDIAHRNGTARPPVRGIPLRELNVTLPNTPPLVETPF